jgi:chromosome partitioning protein
MTDATPRGGDVHTARARLERELEKAFAEDPPVSIDDIDRAGRTRGPSSAPAADVSRETPAAGTLRKTKQKKRKPGVRGGAQPTLLPQTQAQPRTRIIGIVNQKGGVGKTTTAVNLAACLAVAERRTLLIDLDPQGNATSGLGIDKGELDASVYDVLVGGLPLPAAVRPTAIPYLEILPATVDLFGAEIELVSVIGREYRLSSALEGQTKGYEYVLVDCPPSLGLLTVNALTAVDSVLIPIQCEYYALEGLSQLLGTIRIIQKSLNPGLAIEGVLLTMYDQRLNLARQVQEEAVEYFGEKVYATVIPRNVRLSEAPSFGQPVILYDILSAGAVSYMKLTEELIERCRPRERG